MKTSIILHARHNEFSPKQMMEIVALGEKYGGYFRHVVTGIQIYNITKEDKECIIRELPEGIVQVKHRGVNNLLACVGKGNCKNGLMETRELEAYIDAHHYGKGTAHKCKIGISGCGRNCADVMVKDIGFYGTINGFVMTLGGTTGHRPQAGQIIARNLSVEQAKKAIDIVINWYISNAEPKERIAKVLDRLGNPLENIDL